MAFTRAEFPVAVTSLGQHVRPTARSNTAPGDTSSSKEEYNSQVPRKTSLVCYIPRLERSVINRSRYDEGGNAICDAFVIGIAGEWHMTVAFPCHRMILYANASAPGGSASGKVAIYPFNEQESVSYPAMQSDPCRSPDCPVFGFNPFRRNPVTSMYHLSSQVACYNACL